MDGVAHRQAHLIQGQGVGLRSRCIAAGDGCRIGIRPVGDRDGEGLPVEERRRRGLDQHLPGESAGREPDVLEGYRERRQLEEAAEGIIREVEGAVAGAAVGEKLSELPLDETLQIQRRHEAKRRVTGGRKGGNPIREEGERHRNQPR